MKPFILLDHDADLAVEVYGKTPEELFENAVFALFSIMIEGREDVGDLEMREVRIKRDGELLISFLNELLFLWDTERFIVFKVQLQFETDGVFARLYGKKFDPKNFLLKREIKAATYHSFMIEKRNDGYVARVVFDV